MRALAVNPVPLDHASCTDRALVAHAQAAWDEALALGEEHGYRNAQATVIAPTGTIGLVMDCDTTGIEPDFALVKFKKLAGGGYFKIINQAVPEALRSLGYGESQHRRDHRLCGGACLPRPGARHQRTPPFAPSGFTDEKIEAVERGLKSAFDIKFVFNKWTLGEDFLTGTLKACPRRSWRTPPSSCSLSSASARSRHRGGERARVRRHDAGKRPAPEARSLRGLRLRQSVRSHRQALPVGREPHPHDGRGAALHFGGDLQDHQHAQRRHGRGLQGGLPALVEASR
jgi:ribonucleotide reductase alpha subunit